MSKKGIFILIVAVFMVSGFAGTVSAEADYGELYNDPIGDVVDYSYKEPVDDPNVDVIEMSSAEAGENIEITLRVAGVLDNEAHGVMVNCMADGVDYRWSYTKATASGGKTDDIMSMNWIDFTIDGGNFTFIVPKTQMSAEQEFVLINGTADYNAYTVDGMIWYGDLIEGGTSSYNPDGGDDDDDDGGDGGDGGNASDGDDEGTKLGPFKTSDGKPIAGENVTVETKGTRAVYQALTDSEGYATFSEKIPKGNYSLKVEVEGDTVIESELSISSTNDATYDGNTQPSLSEKSYKEIYDDPENDTEEPDDEEKKDSPGFGLSLAVLGVLCVFFIVRKYQK